MTAGQNGSSNGGGRPLWVAGLSPPDSWRSLRQPGNPQLHQFRHPQHRVWGHESKPEVSNFRLAKVSNFRLGLTDRRQTAIAAHIRGELFTPISRRLSQYLCPGAVREQIWPHNHGAFQWLGTNYLSVFFFQCHRLSVTFDPCYPARNYIPADVGAVQRAHMQATWKCRFVAARTVARF